MVKKILLNSRQKETLKTIVGKLEFHIDFSTNYVDSNNITQFISKLKELNDLLKIQYKADLIKYKELQIKEFIQQRYYINSNVYEGLMDEITIDEINYHISLLPMGKASGPSSISYEMIKNASDEMKHYIKDMLNECLRLKKIPQEWKLADLYPIPKPKPWGCKLVNTRPIVLLETIRKLMVSILNRRCSKIFKENEILKGNQFAGLEGNSTFEPIRIIKEIIQDAIKDKKELWILALELMIELTFIC
ncbi:hypothetical protein RhiirC2_791273 [Rhizophagus irregularis]|uniref:Reverse transcriptase domain-containing protein n=1 Tax=Rhizophagus irregularis TaxID=588596 RepID=A0A2N1MJJ6_9GLOM|nr:hypothetical protein RhiirC2_791273 [Rhizophagus irregularis]